MEREGGARETRGSGVAFRWAVRRCPEIEDGRGRLVGMGSLRVQGAAFRQLLVSVRML